MTLKLICGPTGSGKTTRAIEAFMATLDRGGQAVFIAPSGPDARHFERQILGLKPVVTGGTITTFGDLCDDINRAADFEPRVISDVERRILLKAITDNAKLSFLEESSKYEGFLTALDGLLAEMEQAGIGSKKLANAGKGLIVPELNSDLFTLFSSYEELLAEQKTTDTSLAHRHAVEKLAEDPSLLPYDFAVVDGFWDFTPLERTFLAAWETSAVEVIITVPYAEGAMFSEATGQHFADLLQRSDCEFLEARPEDRRPPELVHLGKFLFEEIDDTEKIPSDDRIMVLEATGDRGQAEMVAAEILEIWRAGVTGLDDIAVVFRKLGAGARAVASALDDFGIPCDLPSKEPLRETPLGQAVVSLLDFVARSLTGKKGAFVHNESPRDTLLRYLRSSFPVTDSQKVDEFAREAFIAGIDDPAGLIHKWKDLGGRDLREIVKLKKAAKLGLADIGREVTSLANYLVSRRIMAGEDSLGLNNPESGEIDIGALKIISGICEEASRLDAAGYSAVEAVLLIRDGIRTASLRSPSARSRGCVRLLDPHRVLNQRFDVIFLCGLLEREFPLPGREEPFFADSVRGKLKEAGLDITANQGRLEDERFLFHRTLTRAQQKVYLCYPYCSSEGKENVTSLFVDEVLELFEEPDLRQRRRRVISEVTFSPGKAPREKQALQSLCLTAGELRPLGNGGIPQPVAEGLITVAREAGIDDRLGKCLESTSLKEPVFHDTEIRAKFENRKLFSASQLENYARCPFAFYVDRILKPALMGTDSYNLERGSIAHDVLCEFSRAMKPHLYLGKADAGQLSMARGKMQDLLSQELEERALGSDAESALLRFTLQFHLDRFIDREAGYSSRLEPDGFELKFGDGETVGALHIGEGLSLRGKIDRVDRVAGGAQALAIDYKTSANISTVKDSEKEQKVQIQLYMLALRQYGLVPVGGEYYSIMGNSRRGIYLKEHAELFGNRNISRNDWLSREEFDRVLDEAEQMALALAKGIRAMQFGQAGVEKRVCNNCDYGTLCRQNN